MMLGIFLIAVTLGYIIALCMCYLINFRFAWDIASFLIFNIIILVLSCIIIYDFDKTCKHDIDKMVNKYCEEVR
jgi:hypothetical protein